MQSINLMTGFIPPLHVRLLTNNPEERRTSDAIIQAGTTNNREQLSSSSRRQDISFRLTIGGGSRGILRKGRHQFK